MPEVSAAFLCDYASVREGLLHILGGGITRIWRDEFPSPLGVGLAVMFELHRMELGRPHEVAIEIRDEDGASLAEIRGGFGADSIPAIGPHEKILVPLAIGLHGLQVQKHGDYEATIAVDGQYKRTLQFAVRPTAEKGQLPPAPPPPE